MSKVINILLIIVVAFSGFIYRDRIQNTWSQAFSYYFPCKTSIKYSIGEFDERFGISRESFISAMKSAEDVWEGEVNKNLFEYSENGRLKVNLIYDVRQESTVQLKNLGYIVDENKSSYDELKAKYENIVSEYEKQKRDFEIRLASFQTRQLAYEKEVASWNKKGGASGSNYDRLNAERDYLAREYESIQDEQKDLNATVVEINNLIISLNQLAKTLNIGVDRYNDIGGSLDGEFDEGIFRTGPEGQEIDIYQFENRTKLIRVLAHEFGHALGLEHIDDPRAIMYRLNNGTNDSASAGDVEILKDLCGISS